MAVDGPMRPAGRPLSGLRAAPASPRRDPPPPPPDPALAGAYAVLLALRAGSALLGTGYLHPDEHFQSVEVVAGDVLGLQVVRTWEFNSERPCRSIAPIGILLGPPLALVRIVNAILVAAGGPAIPLGLAALLVSRLVFLLLSFSVDAAVYNILRGQRATLRALVLLASSHVQLAYGVRTFTNSVETCIVAWCLWCVAELARKTGARPKTARVGTESFMLGVLFAAGIFTRISFLPFAAAFGAAFLLALLRLWRSNAIGTAGAIFAITFATTGFALASGAMVLMDTAYYGQLFVFEKGRPTTWPYFFGRALADPLGALRAFTFTATPVLTPLNSLRYNSDPENLASHGLHPRYLHLLVNFPVLYGPLAVYVPWYLRRQLTAGKPPGFVQQAAAWAAGTSLAALSAVPHQEARFLVPLLPCLVVLVYGKQGRPPLGSPVKSHAVAKPPSGKWRVWFWVPWIAFNASATALLGFAHQGGIVPALVWIGRRELPVDSGVPPPRLVFWKTYMPPRYLLGWPAEDRKSLDVVDLAGRGADEVAQILAFSADEDTGRGGRTLFVAPAYAQHLVPGGNGTAFRLRLLRSFKPHLNLDDAGDVARWMSEGKVGETVVESPWKELMSLGVWELDREP